MGVKPTVLTWNFIYGVLDDFLDLFTIELSLIRRVGRLQFWCFVFFGGNDANAEAPVLWPPHAKSCLIGKDSDAGRDWGQEEMGTTEDEMTGWHHRLDGHEFEWTPGDGDGQGGLACCDSWGHKESDMTEQLNWTECKLAYIIYAYVDTIIYTYYIKYDVLYILLNLYIILV